jgi:hypothetical protein
VPKHRMSKLEIRTTEAAGELGVFADFTPQGGVPFWTMTAGTEGAAMLQAIIDIYNSTVDRENGAQEEGFADYAEKFGAFAADAKRFQFLGTTEVGHALAERRLAGHHFDFEGQGWRTEGDAIQTLRGVVDAEIEAARVHIAETLASGGKP